MLLIAVHALAAGHRCNDPMSSAPCLANALVELAAFPLDFDWAAEGLENYSIEAASQAFAAAIHELP